MLRGHYILFFKPFAGLARRSVPVAARVAIQVAKVIVYWSCLELFLFVQCSTSTFGPAKSSKHWSFMKQNHKFKISFASFNLNYMLKEMIFVAWCFVALENLICLESAHVAWWAISNQSITPLSLFSLNKIVQKSLKCPTSPNLLKPQIQFHKKSQA